MKIDKISMEFHDFKNAKNHKELVDRFVGAGFEVTIRLNDTDSYLYARRK